MIEENLDTQVSDAQSMTQAEPSSDITSPESIASDVNSDPSIPAAETPKERMYSKSEMAKIMSHQTKQAAERARQETERNVRAEMEQRYSERQSNSDGNHSQADIQRLINEEVERREINIRAQHISDTFYSKVNAAVEEDPSFAQMYRELNIEGQPTLAAWVTGLDNTADVIREFATHPEKYASVLMLVNSGSPHMAMKRLQALSKSIKDNKAALNQPKSSEPLTQVSSSRSASISNGRPTIEDFRRKYRG